MPRSSNQKLKLLYVKDYLTAHSDLDHPVTTAQLIAHLAAQGIAAERKSIYNDIQSLRDYGLDILQINLGGTTGYYLADRDFELPELKLLVDSVQSSKFITHKKTMSLIKKLEGLTSVHQARQLNRQVYVLNRVKTMNESIYYNVDEIHTGIATNKQIRFRYFEYTVGKERRFRKNGEWYVISPFALTWDDENYYLVGFDSQADIIKHFRVDKMAEIETLDQERDGQAAFAAMDMGTYTRRVFGMFSGEPQSVHLRFENRLVGAVLDRLGQEVMLIADGPDHFTLRTEVVVSPQFFAWLCGFGPKAKLIGPESVVREMRDYVRSIAELY